jgi:predicted nucleic acid-binding protein
VTVLVDTTIWSLALRRRPDQLSPSDLDLVSEWQDLAVNDQAVLTGIIRQEVLSGIREETVFASIQELLADFRCLEILPGDFDQAARFFNICRAGGVTGTAVDMLICATAYRHNLPIFTTDGDFPLYAPHLPIRLHVPRS